jgi:phosphonate transport system substrate-binding protein
MSHQLTWATFLAPNMFPVYQFIAEYVSARAGYHGRLVVGHHFDQFTNGEADVGFLCGLPYVVLARQMPAPVDPLAAPVLRGERYSGRPVYFSDVIVRREAPWQSFAELHGRAWAYNEPNSHSGYGVTCFHLAQMGANGRFFGRIVEAGFHQKAIRMVLSGEVDASAIDSQVLAIEMRDQPELKEQLRVIDSLGPSPIQPVVAASRLPSSLKAEIRTALVAMHTDPAAANQFACAFIDRFVPVTDANYDDIRTMLATAASAGVCLQKDEG